jgi:hypothetical protein
MWVMDTRYEKDCKANCFPSFDAILFFFLSLFLIVDKYIDIYLVSESVKSNVKLCGFRIDT